MSFVPESEKRCTVAGTFGTWMWSSETLVPLVPGRMTRLLFVSMALQVGLALAGCKDAAVGGSRTDAVICANVMAPVGLESETAGAGPGAEGEGAPERRKGVAEEEGDGLGPVEVDLTFELGLDRPVGGRFTSGLGFGADGKRMLGPAARTVSIAVAMAVCMGMLGRAVTVAATMLAI